MPFIVYSENNLTSKNIADAIKKEIEFEEADIVEGMPHFKSENVDMLAMQEGVLDASFLDSCIKTDLIIFPCSHRSAKGVPSFTVHSEGNWSGEAMLGGQPKRLSTASPDWMLSALRNLVKNNATELPVLYEATHHGPLLKTPSFFIEVGGTEQALSDKGYAAIVAKSIVETLDSAKDYDSCTFGIGSMHYPEKFTRLALSKGYAFSHIMPKYYAHEIDMIKQGVESSSISIDKAIIEWKGLKALDRNKIIEELNVLGIDYERV
jgi:D-aminoacyl-tRNA deacylase